MRAFAPTIATIVLFAAAPASAAPQQDVTRRLGLFEFRSESLLLGLESPASGHRSQHLFFLSTAIEPLPEWFLGVGLGGGWSSPRPWPVLFERISAAAFMAYFRHLPRTTRRVKPGFGVTTWISGGTSLFLVGGFVDLAIVIPVTADVPLSFGVSPGLLFVGGSLTPMGFRPAGRLSVSLGF